MTFAGIDVSKPHLDLALVSNSPKLKTCTYSPRA